MVVFVSFLTVGTYKNKEQIMDALQPIGHTRYRNVRFGTSGKIRYTQIKRRPHIKIKVVTVGNVGFPMARRAALRISLIPQIK